MPICNDQKCVNLYTQFIIIYILICKILHHAAWHAGDQVAFLAFSSSVFLGQVFIVFFLTVCGVRVAWIGWLVSHSSSMISQAFGSIGTVGR